MIELTAAQRDWIANRAVEILFVMPGLDDDVAREEYIKLVLGDAFNEGRRAANTDAIKRVLGWPFPATPDAKETAA